MYKTSNAKFKGNFKVELRDKFSALSARMKIQREKKAGRQ